MDYGIYGILNARVPEGDNGSILYGSKLWVIEDGTLWRARSIRRADMLWRQIPEQDLPRYASLDIKKDDRLHPIKYLIQLAARTLLERYDGRI